MNANYPAEIFMKYYNIIKHDCPKYIQEYCVQVACHIKTLRLKLIPFAHVHFSAKFNILCEFGLSKKMFSPCLPWFQKNK